MPRQPAAMSVPQPDAEPAGGKGVAGARWALVGLSLAMLLSALGTSVANVALPSLAQAFQSPFQDVQWVVLAYLLAITSLIVGAGRLGDLLGRRRLLLAGLGLFTLASLACGLAPTLWLLVGARAAQGLGAALLMALTLAFIGDTVPKARTGRAMGLLGTMSALGTALGPSLGGVLLAGFGWPAVFLVSVPIGLLAFVLCWRFLPVDPASPKPERQGFDLPGTLVLTLSLAAYALAMTTGRGSFGVVNAGLLLAAGAGLGLFVRIEGRARSPLLPLAMFREAGLGSGLAANGLVSTVMMATLVVGPFYLARGLGLQAALVGLVMSIGPIVSALSGIVAGRLVDRLGPALAAMAGLVEMAAGATALVLLPPLFGVAGYIAAMIVLTPGYQLFQAANNSALLLGAPAGQRGVRSGVVNLSRNLGLITGASAMGALFAMAIGGSEVASASASRIAAGTQITFAVAAALIVAAIGLLRAGRMRRKLELADATEMRH